MSRAARWVLAAVALQAALVGVYLMVERQRAPSSLGAPVTDPPRRVDMIMPSLTVRRRDGSSARLAPSARQTLVHVWATWCPPCRAELPGLLALPARHPAEVVAIALDERWADVERFLGGSAASNVVLADGKEVARALDVRRLPVTFLMSPEGRIVLRFDGARDWTDEAFIDTYLEEAGDDR